MVSIMKWILGAILLLMAAVVGIVIGPVVFLAMAFMVTHPLVLGIVGVVVSGFVAGGLAHLLGRWFARNHRRRVAVSFGVATALLLGVAGGIFLFRPQKFDQPNSIDRSGVRFESLTTRSRLAYRVLPAQATVRRGTVILCHGGPGADAVTNKPCLAALSPLANAGFDVCLYDQIGCGLSARLADPEEYTAARNVADLEALRQFLGWDRPVMIGESWGAQLIARYAAKYPREISAAVLVSPGPLRLVDWVDRETGSVTDRISDDQERAFYNILGARLVTAMLLFRINPKAAFRFLPEADAEWYGSAILAALSPGAVCDAHVLPDNSRPFFNLWVAQMTNLSMKSESRDQFDGLPAAEFPVLVMRGDCDYAHGDVAADYVDAFPEAEPAAVADAGHFTLLEKPEVFLAEVREFLVERY